MTIGIWCRGHRGNLPRSDIFANIVSSSKRQWLSLFPLQEFGCLYHLSFDLFWCPSIRGIQQLVHYRPMLLVRDIGFCIVGLVRYVPWRRRSVRVNGIIVPSFEHAESILLVSDNPVKVRSPFFVFLFAEQKRGFQHPLEDIPPPVEIGMPRQPFTSLLSSPPTFKHGTWKSFADSFIPESRKRRDMC